MKARRLRNEFTALAIVVAVILYGSLYPFDFIIPNRNTGPLQTLLGTWKAIPERGDVLANLVFYLPLGFVAARAFSFAFGAPAGFLLTFLTGAGLSISCELGQYYVFGRVESATDVYTDTIGAMLGAPIGIVFRREPLGAWPQKLRDQPFPALLLASWMGDRLYPYVPVIDLAKYWDALKPAVLYPQFTLYDFFRYTVMWLTVFALTDAVVGQKWPRSSYPLLAGFVLLAKVLIISQIVTLHEIAGVGTGFLAWLAISRQPPRRRALMVVLPLYVYVVLWRLEPFEFQTAGRSFGWSVFSSFLNGATDVNVQSFLEKIFYYGSLVWLTAEAGARLQISAIIVASVLLITSGLEVFLPDRSAEVTDAMLALVIAALINLMNADPASASTIPIVRGEPGRPI